MFRKIAAWLISTVVLLTPVCAQSLGGSLRGEILDSTGARVASAQVLVQAVDSSLQRQAETEDRGEFRVD
ncbi:MAG TPA: carboxypeptidase-like regulatory domain-containing protein, partial [Candidatus Sulfotelmatobacter sp.]|nr:carboxypeptidase-like regulatory domain-containing protein [Candidatus Sulfotelmatobacter sp.]